MMQRRTTQLVVLIFGLLLFVYSILALAQAGGGSSCRWVFTKWLGCILSNRESLAGALFGAAGALVAAWIAWTAVQLQINAERERMMADRKENEQLLVHDLTDYATGMAAAWRLLGALPDGADQESTRRVREATAYMAERVSRPEPIATYRAMAETLGWERRRSYNAVLSGLEKLKPFSDPDAIPDPQEVINVIVDLADEFENCLPATSDYFHGLWRRSHKAWSFADYVTHIGTPPT